MENIVVKSLREKKSKLLEQVDVVDSMIEDELRKTQSTSPELFKEITPQVRRRKPLGGSFGKTLNQKFLSVLKENQRFMKIREIAKEIVLREGGNEKDWVIKLSRRTKKLKEMGKIAKFQVGKAKTNIFWGSPNWLDNGKIKDGFDYDPSALTEAGRPNVLLDFEL